MKLSFVSFADREGGSEGLSVSDCAGHFVSSWRFLSGIVTCTGAGVTVVIIKDEQSDRRLVRGGLFPDPPTPRRQLLELQEFARSRSTLLSAMLAATIVRESEAFISEYGGCN